MILRSFCAAKNLTTFQSFDDSKHENLSQIFFPKKEVNLEGSKLYAGHSHLFHERLFKDYNDELTHYWKEYLEIVAEKFNANIEYVEIPIRSPRELEDIIAKLSFIGKFDILIEELTQPYFLDLVTYKYSHECYMVASPKPYKIYELVLILPLDQFCWIFLGITSALSTVIWRFLDGPGSQWNFLFGIYSLFVGQFSEIRT